MKRYYRKLALGGLALLAMASCQNREFTIEGTIEGAADTVLYLENAALTGIVQMDSVKLTADGHFSFSEEAPTNPEFYVLRIGNQIINLSIDSTETVTVKAKMPGMASNYAVEGSDNCQKIRELSLRQQDLLRRAMALEQDFSLSRAEAQDSLARMVETYKRGVIRDYIYQAPNQAYAYFALFQTLGQWAIFTPQSNRDDMRAFAAVATSWETFHPDCPRTQNLHNITIDGMKTARIVDSRQSQQLSESQVVESGVIELDLTDNHGQQRRLTDLKGKVVLLDFHSFTLKDSPQRILMLRELYNKYHAQGLEIYQVSIDGDEHYWKQQTQELPWISVRDNSTQSVAKYNVGAVPEYFTIDRQNQLQKRSTQIADLDKEIAGLLSFRAD